jgi:hypothetical protein
MAPSAERVNGLMFDLFDWLACSDEHPLILSSIFHYEFAFIRAPNWLVLCFVVMLNNSHLDVHKLDSQQVNN